jgi:hypothetical protein
MRSLISVFALLLGCSAAHGQSLTTPRTFAPARAQAWNSEQLECLVRKSNGKRECHTRTEWRKIADQLAKADAQRALVR